MGDIYKINDVNYDCEFKLKNPDGQEVKFTKSALRGLTITDNFFNPFLVGSVAIANPYDLVEDKYLLRGDGRDVFSIEIFPEDKPKDKLKYDFILFSEENFGNPEVRSENIKKLSMMHKDALPFMDTIPYGKICSGKAGDILKDIFKELLGEDMVDNDEWQSGDFTLTYHPPLTFRYMDLMNYLLKHYYAKDGDMYVKGFIHFDEEKGKYQLRLLSKIFEKNKDEVMEAFTLSDFADVGDTSNDNNPPPDAEVSEYNNGIKNIGYSTPMYGINNDFFINTVVYGYDPILGIHKTRIKKLEDIEKQWEKKFVKSFKAIGGEPKPFVVKNKNTKQKFRHFRSPYPVEDSEKMVEAEMINTLTFYNLRAIFANLGSANRVGGKFIDIVKVGEGKQKSDEKLLGRWFVHELRHIFLGDGYTNEFSCCKTYSGPNTKITPDAE
jgi:hypothetical protein